MLIGFFAAGQWSQDGWFLVSGILAAFLLRQPLSIMVKAYAGRRSRSELPAARLWFSVYTLLGLFSLVNLIRAGHLALLWLAIPGILVFIWHLFLVSKRTERYQMGIDIIASGTLALAAPAAYWLSASNPDSTGWWLWVLTWLQSAASIVYAFMRLEQRKLKDKHELPSLKSISRRALLYSGFNLLLTAVLSIARITPPLLWIAFSLQFAETLWGITKPAIGYKPALIGLRQLLVSVTFTVLFILLWRP